MRKLAAAFAAIFLILCCSAPAAGPVETSWTQFNGFDSYSIRAVVARPPGRGPFPVVLLLHGSHGFGHEYVQLAEDLAAGGFLAIAPCWFNGGSGPGQRFITNIACPESPPAARGDTPEAQRVLRHLVSAATHIPGARPHWIALFGHSRGAGASLFYAISGGAANALVLNSGAYPPEHALRARAIEAPLLLLHGEKDDPSDGGSPMTSIHMAKDFATAARKAGKTVETKYYPDGHNGLFSNRAQYADTLRTTLDFLRKHAPR